MDIAQLVLRSKNVSPLALLTDHNFKLALRPHRVLATARAAQVVFNRPYNDRRNAEFVRDHDTAWARFITSLANWEQFSSTLVLPRKERVMVAAWHFPEVSTVFAFAKQVHALLLVSQDAPWLESLKASGCTLNMFADGASMKLAREMQGGRVVAAMLDHSYPDTHCEKTILLGRTVNTPSGILELCSRFGYLIVFVAPRATGVEVVAEFDATGHSASNLAQRYNHWLEMEIKRASASWLMWQAFPSA